MKVSELLEAPLPDDWDKSKFEPGQDFEDMLKYALDRSEEVGSGSSRVAFGIPYQNRKTILKVAKNNNGLKQNKQEAEVLADRMVAKLNIVIPLIDFDETTEYPRWINVEKAEPMNIEAFKKFFDGFTTVEVVQAIQLVDKESPDKYDNMHNDIFKKMIDTNQYFAELLYFTRMLPDLYIHDFTDLGNWGVYKNKPVIIDVGATTEFVENMF